MTLARRQEGTFRFQGVAARAGNDGQNRGRAGAHLPGRGRGTGRALRRGARPDRTSIETCRHAELAARANRYARWALAQDIAKGDTVALLLPNRPDYLAIWLGITRIGGVVALINTNLKGEALAHCLRVAKPKHIIAGEKLADGLDGHRASSGAMTRTSQRVIDQLFRRAR